MRKFKYIILFVALFAISLSTFLFLESKLRVTYEKNIKSTMNTTTSDYTVFLGDNITANFDLDKYFQNETLVNQGVTGDTIGNLMERLDNTISLSPKKIVLMIGLNDLINDNGLNPSIKENYNNLVTSIINRSNETEIVLESILPVNSERYCKLNEDIIKLNDYIKSLSKKYNLAYIDLHDNFSSKSKLVDTLCLDGITPNDEGYKLIRDNLKSYI